MSPTRKYATDEDRLAARRLSRRKYYVRHLEEERARARHRWHARASSHEQGVVRVAPSAQETLMPATSKYLGPSLLVEDDTFLGPLRDVLEHDLAGWHGILDPRTVWDRLAQRLIGEERRKEPSKRLHQELAIKKQHAGFVQAVALDGAQKAYDRGGPDCPTWLALQDTGHRARALLTGVEELEELSELKNGTLKRLHGEGNLHYQSS